METILNYLDTMFLNMPDTPEVRRAKEELAGMMEDKYNELLMEGRSDNEAVGIVISEFGNLNELSEELGIAGVSEQQTDAQARVVTDQEVKDYMKKNQDASQKIGIGVLLCICSPILIIVLDGFREAGYISEMIADGFGASIMFIMIAIAVGIFIFQGMKINKYEYLKKSRLQLNRSTETYLRNLQEKETSQFALKISVGVAIILCGIIPLFFAEYFGEVAEMLATGTLLLLIGIAVQFFISAGMRRGVFAILLQEEDYSVEKKRTSKVMEAISSIYWLIATAVYLTWSFLTMDWHITWIVWVVAGVLYGVVEAVVRLTEKE